MEAPRRTRYFFWVLLGVLSTVLPEVMAGSDLYPFFDLFDYLLMIPLYSLHCLVLWYIIWANGRPRLYNLFPAGAIFGLYEAYLTKVIWNPYWTDTPLKIGGIAVVETLVLVLFWHSILAFIVPLLVTESLTSSNEIFAGLPEWITNQFIRFRGRRWLTIPIMFGIFQSINTPTLRDSILSGATCTVITYLLIQAWKRTNGPNYTMKQLLPSPREFRVLLGLLAVMYVLMGVFWRPESLPDLSGHVTVIILYLFFAGLLYRGIQRSQEDQHVNLSNISISNGSMVLFGLFFTLGSVLGKVSGIAISVVYLVWYGGILFGVVLLVDTVRSDLFS